MASKKKLVTSAVALGVAAAIGLGGTFAWQSINQTALNEASDIVNPGGRLHNDQWFVDAKTNNNDIYVENFTDEENGEDIFARVRLSEYMEIVMNYGIEGAEVVETIAGSKTPVVDEEGNQVDADLSADDATRKNQFTYEYETHFFHKENATDDYWEWNSPDKNTATDDLPYFIPTFNLDKDSLLADLNGDYEMTLGGISNREEAQYTRDDEYKDIGENSTVSRFEVYDGDTDKLPNVTDQTDLRDLIENGTSATNYDTYKDKIVLSKEKVEHTAKQVGVSNGLISMSDWNKLDDGAKADYWVYDDSDDGDGWVYWSSPIEAGETTGLLLDSTELKEVMDDTWYYAIYVEAQFVTADDVGKNDKTGFYADGETVSDAAEKLLEEIGVDTSGRLVLSDITMTVEENNDDGVHNGVGTRDVRIALDAELDGKSLAAAHTDDDYNLRIYVYDDAKGYFGYATLTGVNDGKFVITFSDIPETFDSERGLWNCLYFQVSYQLTENGEKVTLTSNMVRCDYSATGDDSSSGGGQNDPAQHTLSIAGVYGDNYVCDIANLGGRGVIAFTATLDSDSETSIDVSKLTGNLYENAEGGEPISTGTYFEGYESQYEYIMPNKVKSFPEGEVTYYFSVTYTDGDSSVTSNRIAYKFLKRSAALTQAGATITIGRNDGVCLTLDGVENITDGYSWNNSMVDQIKMTHDGAELKAKLRSASEDGNMEIYLWTTEDAFENVEDRYHVWMVINYAQETVMFTSGAAATYNVPFAIEIDHGGTAYKGTLTVVSGN